MISSLAGTGTNITEFTTFEYKTAGKWLELLKEIAPHVARVAFVFGGAKAGPTGEGFYGAISGVAPFVRHRLDPDLRGQSRRLADPNASASLRSGSCGDTDMVANAL